LHHVRPRLEGHVDWLEYADWWNPILQDPLRVQDGMAKIDPAQGSGVSWNEKTVGRYSASGIHIDRCPAPGG
jgi:L-alanine-DL-glutamate epimerase-like enolase superfamily enzyme